MTSRFLCTFYFFEEDKLKFNFEMFLLVAVILDFFLKKNKQQPLFIFYPTGMVEIIYLDILNVHHLKLSADFEVG